jgi:hypothetical protein
VALDDGPRRESVIRFDAARSASALESTIRALLQGKLTTVEVADVLLALVQRKVIEMSDGKVSYLLDA